MGSQANKIFFVVGYEKIVDLKALASILSINNLSMASPERLRRYLCVDPGAVTILGVVNDLNKEVEVIIDEILWDSNTFRCHPLVNTSTLVISKENLMRIFDITGHKIRIVDVPGKNLIH